MSRIATTFSRLKAAQEGALVVYLTAGDPSAEASARYMEAAAKGGADVIELGIPFSDPTADGPTIQAASVRALQGGMTLGKALDLVRAFRAAGHQQPIVLFGYANPFFQHGYARLAKEAAEAGADALLVVDLPPEEAGDLVAALRAEGLDFIPLVAPTSGAQRLGAAKGVASGFTYVVSRTGVTGSAKPDPEMVKTQAAAAREALGLPTVAGFGVALPEDVAALAPTAEGVVVGSALVQAIAKAGPTPGAEAFAAFEARVRELKAPLKAQGALVG